MISPLPFNTQGEHKNMESNFLYCLIVMGQGGSFKLREEISSRYKEKLIYLENDEALAHVAQRSCGYPMPGGI